MKKLIIAAFILLVTTAHTFAGPIVTISVEFGHGPDCIEKGICKISVGVSKGIMATINDNTGNLELSIVKSSLKAGIYESQFINGIFQVPVAYSLPADVCAKLGIDKYTVRVGKYKVVETKTGFTIVLVK
jgi:hypothetical protein